MRGGIEYPDIMNSSLAERELMGKIAEENIKITEKSGLPFF